MGGGPCKENLLIILFGPKDEDSINEIRRRFPYIDVTYTAIDGGEDKEVLRERLKRTFFFISVILWWVVGVCVWRV
jgi:hypothetical protein